MSYRSRAECRAIVQAIISEGPLAPFALSKAEENFFRARTSRSVDKLAIDTATFKQYYHLPVAKPLWNLIIASTSMVLTGLAVAWWFYVNSPATTNKVPLITGCIVATVAAVGWTVAGGFTHRNTIRQNTNNILFARFSQSPIADALHRFHREFGYNEHSVVTVKRVLDLRSTQNEDDWKAAASVGFILNYFELISSGVIRGDLDKTIVSDNIRGVIVYYHDMCEPFILEAARGNAKVYDKLRKMRAHYREP